MSHLDQLMRGAIDIHVHAAPDPFEERRFDVLDLAIQAKEMGMKAIVIKSHFYCTAPLAYLVNKLVSDFHLVGSFVINGATGGLNAEVVDTAAESGARVIWMPTYSSPTDTKRRTEGKFYPVSFSKTVPVSEICLINDKGELCSPMNSILEIIKSKGMVLCTGHISVPEIYAVTTEARRMGIKVVVTHPLSNAVGSHLATDQQQELVTLGAYIEHTFMTCMPMSSRISPAEIVKHVKTVGAEHCILSTDFGQNLNPSPPEGMRMMIANMLKFGLSEKELDLLVRINPAKLLSLD